MSHSLFWEDALEYLSSAHLGRKQKTFNAGLCPKKRTLFVVAF
jgi:hypothetical protein